MANTKKQFRFHASFSHYSDGVLKIQGLLLDEWT